jgi:hypothetical protein
MGKSTETWSFDFTGRLKYAGNLLWGAGSIITAAISVVALADFVLSKLPTQVPPPTTQAAWRLPHLATAWWLFLIVLSLLGAVIEKSYRLRREAKALSDQSEAELADARRALAEAPGTGGITMTGNMAWDNAGAGILIITPPLRPADGEPKK